MEFVDSFGTGPLGTTKLRMAKSASVPPDSMRWLSNASTYKAWVRGKPASSWLRYLSTASEPPSDVGLWVSSSFEQRGAEIVYVDCHELDAVGVLGRILSQTLSYSAGSASFKDRIGRMLSLDRTSFFAGRTWLEKHIALRDFLGRTSTRDIQDAKSIIEADKITKAEVLAESLDIFEALTTSGGKTNAFVNSFSPQRIDDAWSLKQNHDLRAQALVARELLQRYTLKQRLAARDRLRLMETADVARAYIIAEAMTGKETYPPIALLLRILNAAMRSRTAGDILVVLDRIESIKGLGAAQLLGQLLVNSGRWDGSGYARVFLCGSSNDGAETVLDGVAVVNRDTERQGTLPQSVPKK